VVFDDNTNSYIEQVLRGYKKTIARKKHEGIMSTEEGKKLLEFDAHAAVCRVMDELQPNRRRHTNSESVFGVCLTGNGVTMTEDLYLKTLFSHVLL
jgi:hypothetical protein